MTSHVRNPKRKADPATVETDSTVSLAPLKLSTEQSDEIRKEVGSNRRMEPVAAQVDALTRDGDRRGQPADVGGTIEHHHPKPSTRYVPRRGKPGGTRAEHGHIDDVFLPVHDTDPHY